MEYPPFEDVFLIENGDVPASHVSFPGCKNPWLFKPHSKKNPLKILGTQILAKKNITNPKVPQPNRRSKFLRELVSVEASVVSLFHEENRNKLPWGTNVTSDIS